jgi:two-component system sensor histidine kinase DesK
MTEPTSLPRPLGRWGPWFAAVWLFFLLDPLSVAWDVRDTAKGVVGLGSTVAFAVLYMAIWIQLRRDRANLIARPTVAGALAYFIPLLGIAVVMTICIGQSGTAAAVYCAVAAIMLFRFTIGIAVVAGIAASVIVLGAVVPHWATLLGTAFGVCAASVAVFGIQTMMVRNIQLIKAQEENAGLAVENERTRFARDLHDILGHSLTVITVKAELAQRLLDVDIERTRAELADLERLSRDALADVRRAVEGYRELTLPGELARARTALQAAEIRAEIPNSTDDVPSQLRELFAWVVREGITNVLRHSGARACSIVLSANAVEVRDDGTGPCGTALGSGLVGLQERASAAGGTVVTTALNPGYSLRVVVP